MPSHILCSSTRSIGNLLIDTGVFEVATHTLLMATMTLNPSVFSGLSRCFSLSRPTNLIAAALFGCSARVRGTSVVYSTSSARVSASHPPFPVCVTVPSMACGGLVVRLAELSRGRRAGAAADEAAGGTSEPDRMRDGGGEEKPHVYWGVWSCMAVRSPVRFLCAIAALALRCDSPAADRLLICAFLICSLQIAILASAACLPLAMSLIHRMPPATLHALPTMLLRATAPLVHGLGVPAAASLVHTKGQVSVQQRGDRSVWLFALTSAR
jgi:hypothetical protein